MKNTKIRNLLKLLHYILLIIHVITVVAHSFEIGVFRFEFWLTLIVNALLLVDLEKVASNIFQKVNSIYKANENFLFSFARLASLLRKRSFIKKLN